MEVLSLCNKLKQLLEIENIEDASDKLLINLLDDNKRSKMIDKWLIFCPDLTKDYMQIIFQEELADRKEKKQDYTPSCLGKLLAELSNGKKVYDCCAGSGSLTIQYWLRHKKAEFVCYELDNRVIPYLLFNLSERNINAFVLNGNALKNEVERAYKVTSTDKYSKIEKIEILTEKSGYNEQLSLFS